MHSESSQNSRGAFFFLNWGFIDYFWKFTSIQVQNVSKIVLNAKYMSVYWADKHQVHAKREDIVRDWIEYKIWLYINGLFQFIRLLITIALNKTVFN